MALFLIGSSYEFFFSFFFIFFLIREKQSVLERGELGRGKRLVIMLKDQSLPSTVLKLQILQLREAANNFFFPRVKKFFLSSRGLNFVKQRRVKHGRRLLHSFIVDSPYVFICFFTFVLQFFGVYLDVYRLISRHIRTTTSITLFLLNIPLIIRLLLRIIRASVQYRVFFVVNIWEKKIAKNFQIS